MNKESKNVFKDLIFMLLEADSHELALEILHKAIDENPDLLSTELVEEMYEISHRLRSRELEEIADWLQNFAEQLSEVIKDSSFLSNQNIYEDYFNYLQFLLGSKNGDNENIQKSNIISHDKENFTSKSICILLEKVLIGVLPNLSEKDLEQTAFNIYDFSNQLSELWSDRNQGGNDAIEASIKGYKIILSVFCSNLEINRSKWGEALFKLGNAYEARVYGSKAQNLENAIEAYKKSLEIYERNTFPEKWGLIQIHLGNIYHVREIGNKADNLEESFEFYQAGLEVFSRESHPEKWAIIQANLGSLYPDRIYVDSLEKTELAISCCQNALSVLDKASFPEYWAQTQCILGEVYRERIIDDIDNYQASIEAFRAALEVYTFDEHPYQWADCQMALGLVYSDMGKYDESLHSYELALRVYCRENSPEDWAKIQDCLGGIYLCLSESNGETKIEYLEKALAAHQAALTVRNREDYPSDWALSLAHLANVYSALNQIDESFACYRAALEFYRENTFYYEFLAIGLSYGSTARHRQRWAESIEGFEMLIEAFELEGTWSRIDVRRKQLSSDIAGFYWILIDTCLKNNQPAKALEFVERSKARYLIDTLYNKTYPRKELYTEEAYQEICDDLNRIRSDIRQEQIRLELEERQKFEQKMREDGTLPPILPENRQYLNDLYKQLDRLTANKIKPFDRSFLLTQKLSNILLEEIQNLLPDRKSVIIEWCILDENFLTFIIQKDTLNVLESQTQDLQALNDWLDIYLGEYSDRQQWRVQIQSSIERLAEILNLKGILEILPADCQQLILIPHRLLHLLPLHALPLPNQNSKCLLDIFPMGVRYAPSCQLLQLTQQKSSQSITNFFGIQNPTQDLTYASFQVEIIQQHFDVVEVLKEGQATKAALTRDSFYIEKITSAHCLHFACHGDFNDQSPLESNLKLSNGEHLTLGEIVNQQLEQCQLVVLSACETGLTDHTSDSDEYIGLPSGFLLAGSPSIVSSLWKVDELATALLMIKFYENLKKYEKLKEGDVAITLNQAQIWLRDLSNYEFEQFVNKYTPEINKVISSLPKSWMREVAQNSLQNALNRQPQPFANPYFWAGFVAIGK